MQTVALRQTVEADASTVSPRGTAALRSLGRHATLAGWTPAIPFQYRAPNPLPLHGSDNGRATRAVLAVVAAVRVPCLLRLDAGHRPGCPPAFSVLGAGLCPRCATGPWAALFSLGRKMTCGSPGSTSTQWAGCALLGGGWTEVLCGGMIGMLFVGGFLAMARVPRLGPATPFILCTGAAIVAHLLALAHRPG